MNNDFVNAIRIPVEASDAEVQDRLNQLHNSERTRDKKIQASKQVLAMDEDSFNAVLAIIGSSIHIDS